eukprot:5301952-Ditylum_brightwellii.AAC.1
MNCQSSTPSMLSPTLYFFLWERSSSWKPAVRLFHRSFPSITCFSLLVFLAPVNLVRSASLVPPKFLKYFGV